MRPGTMAIHQSRCRLSSYSTFTQQRVNIVTVKDSLFCQILDVDASLVVVKKAKNTWFDSKTVLKLSTHLSG